MKEIDDFTKLILNELERNRNAIDKLKADIDLKFENLRRDIAKVHTTEKEIQDIKVWQKEVTETWSPRQMKEAKDELYEQKNKWSKAIGLLIAIEVVVGFIISWILKNI